MRRLLPRGAPQLQVLLDSRRAVPGDGLGLLCGKGQRPADAAVVRGRGGRQRVRPVDRRLHALPGLVGGHYRVQGSARPRRGDSGRGCGA